MKKARIILSAVAVLAVVAGALAFKASRFTDSKVVTTTHSATIGGIVYSTAATFCTTTALEFLTPDGDPGDFTTTWTTAFNAPTFAVTLRRVGQPAQTTTIPAQTTCSLSTGYLTAVN